MAFFHRNFFPNILPNLVFPLILHPKIDDVGVAITLLRIVNDDMYIFPTIFWNVPK